MIEVSIEAIASLTQYYDQALRCFTFRDFQLVPTVEEFEEILGCPIGGRKPYLFFGFYPSMARIAKVVKISTQELDQVKQNRNGVIGIPRKHLEEKAKALADQGCRNLPFSGRATRDSRMRLPWKEKRAECHQSLLEENVRKTKSRSKNFENKRFSSCLRMGKVLAPHASATRDRNL